MRLIRTLLLLVLAIILVVLAFANRELVTVSVQLTEALPGFSARLPLFLVILMAVMLGVAIGIIWEWFRNAALRAEAANRARVIARLEQEVHALRNDHGDPEDEVIAILDHPQRRQDSGARSARAAGLLPHASPRIPAQNPMPRALPAKT